VKAEIKPDLIQPDFLVLEKVISVDVAILALVLVLLVAFFIYKIAQIYPLLCIYFSTSKTGLKNSAYQLTSNTVYIKLAKGNKLSEHQLTVINNIKYQEKNKELHIDLKKAIYQIVIKILTGKSHAI